MSLTTKLIPLSELPIGRTAVVSSIETVGITRRRMLDLGLTPGAVIEALRSSPTGDPKAYKIRGTVIAFRREESVKVLVNLRGD